MGRKKEETRKQQLVRECTEMVKEIRYYAQYPYSFWLGRIVSKLIIRNFQSRLRKKEEELREIIGKEMADARALLSIKEGEKKKRLTQK